MACLNCILFGDRSREIESSTDRMIFTYSIHTFLSKLKELIMFISLWKEALYKLRKIYLNLHHAIFFSNECCVLRVTSKQFLCVCCCWVWMNVWRGCRCPCENTENLSKNTFLMYLTNRSFCWMEAVFSFLLQSKGNKYSYKICSTHQYKFKLNSD